MNLIRAVVLISLFPLVSCNALLTSDESASSMAVTEDLESRTYHFTYTVQVPAPQAGTKVLKVWVPLPMQDSGVQRVTNLKSSIVGNTAELSENTEPVYGNRMLYAEISNPQGETTIRWEADVLRIADVGQGTQPPVKNYRLANRLIPLDGSARELASELGIIDTSLDSHAKARRVFDDVLTGMEYNKKVPGYGLGDFQRALDICMGNCTDFHARFIGTCRAASIPTRFTMGIPMKSDPQGTYNSYHCWAHWFDGRNWNPVDISEADKIVATDPQGADKFFGHLGVDRVALTFGRDLILSPPQQAEPLNYFVFPYVEADGQPVTMDKSMWEFTYKDL